MKKKKKLRVLFISQEIFPYLPESEIATKSRNLPQFVQEKGNETRTFMPKFGAVNERRNQLHEVIRLSGMNLIINDTDHPLIIKVASIQSARLQVYFIDNEDYFSRNNTIADDAGVEYEDNDERTIFFNRGVIETVKKLRWTPDIVHCHGWMTGLSPLYLKKAFSDDPFFENSKIVYSLYNDAFERPFRKEFADNILLDGINQGDIESISNKDEITYTDLSKLAIDFADGVIQSSEVIDNSLLEYAQSKDMKTLSFAGEDYADKYIEFYESLF